MTEQSAAVARIASIANLFDKRRAAVGINVARLELAQMVESAQSELAQLRAALAQAQADANRLRVAAEFNCDAMSEEDWPNECSGCGRVATLAGPECFCADCFRNHWAQAQAERDDACKLATGYMTDVRDLQATLAQAQAERDAATEKARELQGSITALNNLCNMTVARAEQAEAVLFRAQFGWSNFKVVAALERGDLSDSGSYYFDEINAAMTAPATPTPIDSAAWAILAGILNYASEILANRICNDYAIPDTPNNRAFVKAMREWGYGPNAPAEDKELIIVDSEIAVMDWELADYFAHLARELAGLE